MGRSAGQCRSEPGLVLVQGGHIQKKREGEGERERGKGLVRRQDKKIRRRASGMDISNTVRDKKRKKGPRDAITLAHHSNQRKVPSYPLEASTPFPESAMM